jgi:hypothetical protein
MHYQLLQSNFILVESAGHGYFRGIQSLSGKPFGWCGKTILLCLLGHGLAVIAVTECSLVLVPIFYCNFGCNSGYTSPLGCGTFGPIAPQ